MPQIGPLEILVVAVLALVVFGPQKLPEIARSVGRTLSELRKQADGLKSEFRDGMRDEAPPSPAAVGTPVDAPPAVADDPALLARSTTPPTKAGVGPKKTTRKASAAKTATGAASGAGKKSAQATAKASTKTRAKTTAKTTAKSAKKTTSRTGTTSSSTAAGKTTAKTSTARKSTATRKTS